MKHHEWRAGLCRRVWVFCSAVLLGLLAAGCARGTAESSESPAVHTAATFKPGQGLRLSREAIQFGGVRSEDVVTRDVGNARGVAAIPATAVLRTVRGSFVFVENGDWLLRSPVTLGETDGRWAEIKEGLYEGDRVVVAGVEALWLAEIAAVNGGVGCADGH